MNYKSLTKLAKKLTCIAVLTINASNAQSIVNVTNVSPQKTIRSDHVTTDIAARAHSDVQVRKLLRLFAEKKMDTAALYERLREIKGKK